MTNVTIVAWVLRALRQAMNMLMVDLEVPQGDGTAETFQVMRLFSCFLCIARIISCYAKKYSCLDTGLLSGTEDRDCFKKLSVKLLDFLDDLRPDLVFYNTGVFSGRYDGDAVLLAPRHAILNRAADHLSRTV